MAHSAPHPEPLPSDAYRRTIANWASDALRLRRNRLHLPSVRTGSLSALPLGSHRDLEHHPVTTNTPAWRNAA